MPKQYQICSPYQGCRTYWTVCMGRSGSAPSTCRKLTIRASWAKSPENSLHSPHHGHIFWISDLIRSPNIHNSVTHHPPSIFTATQPTKSHRWGSILVATTEPIHQQRQRSYDDSVCWVVQRLWVLLSTWGNNSRLPFRLANPISGIMTGWVSGLKRQVEE